MGNVRSSPIYGVGPGGSKKFTPPIDMLLRSGYVFVDDNPNSAFFYLLSSLGLLVLLFMRSLFLLLYSEP